MCVLYGCCIVWSAKKEGDRECHKSLYGADGGISEVTADRFDIVLNWSQKRKGKNGSRVLVLLYNIHYRTSIYCCVYSSSIYLLSWLFSRKSWSMLSISFFLSFFLFYYFSSFRCNSSKCFISSSRWDEREISPFKLKKKTKLSTTT